MSVKALRLRLTEHAKATEVRLAMPATLDRRLRTLLAEADKDEAHVEMVVRWLMRQHRERRTRYECPSPGEFWVESRRLGVPEGAWEWRLWEHTLALSIPPRGYGEPKPTHDEMLLGSVSYWMGEWTDAALVDDDETIERARAMLELLWEGHHPAP